MSEPRREEDERPARPARRRARPVIGVLGAGTMGAGIAQLGCRSGAQTLLYDPIPEALERRRRAARVTGLRRTKRRAGA